MIQPKNKIYNIAAGLPFLEILARMVLNETADKPELLPQYRILLPTRRTCRLLRESFLNLNNGEPVLLPQLTPLGEVDEDDLALMMFGNMDGILQTKPAIPPLKRQLLLAQLIRKIPQYSDSVDHALALSKALAQFIDQVIVEGKSFEDLADIVPVEFAQHWQITLDFLKIISEAWPKILDAHNMVDPPERRNILLQHLSQHWRSNPPDAPVIAAGSIGSIPAVSQLLQVITTMPFGRVVLPGVDMTMDDETWACLSDTHPQHHLKMTLKQMNVTRNELEDIPSTSTQGKDNARVRLSSLMMLPAEKTDIWHNIAAHNFSDSMFQGLEYYPCAHSQEEATVIALVMRSYLEHKEKVIALVTPDRQLAQRVRAVCARWDIVVDDSAGRKLLDDRLGKLIIQLMEAVRREFNAVAFLSLLKNTLSAFGYETHKYREIVTVMESRILRRGHVILSYASLRDVIIAEDSDESILTFFDCFYDVIACFHEYARQDNRVSSLQMLKAHITALEHIACTPDKNGDAVLWRGDAGKAAALFFNDMIQHAALIGDVTFNEYCAIVKYLLHDVTIRSPYGVHPRLLILGQMESRLNMADVVIISGLNEGVWPPDPGVDPWMSRPMRAQFGLPQSEQMVGIAAHDFVQQFCAPHVIMTRSKKVNGSPTVPSRWLGRLDTVLQSQAMSLDSLSINLYIEWARMMDNVPLDHISPCPRPAPTPPVGARPNGVSITKVETWLRDPYSIYAQYILGLKQQKPLIQSVDAALRGTMIHEICDEFVLAFPTHLPEGAENEFMNIAQRIMHKNIDDPNKMAFWMTRIQTMAQWFVSHEREWRRSAIYKQSEIKGNMDIDVNGLPFNIYGIADRIDKTQTGYALIDYKTGGTFSEKKMNGGALPQLPLEALILSQGGFDGCGFGRFKQHDDDIKKIPKGTVDYIGYWVMTGAREAGRKYEVQGDLSETMENVRNGLVDLIATFRDPSTPFYSVPDAKNMPRFNDYAHLARVMEWSALDTDHDTDGGG